MAKTALPPSDRPDRDHREPVLIPPPRVERPDLTQVISSIEAGQQSGRFYRGIYPRVTPEKGGSRQVPFIFPIHEFRATVAVTISAKDLNGPAGLIAQVGSLPDTAQHALPELLQRVTARFGHLSQFHPEAYRGSEKGDLIKVPLREMFESRTGECVASAITAKAVWEAHFPRARGFLIMGFLEFESHAYALLEVPKEGLFLVDPAMNDEPKRVTGVVRRGGEDPTNPRFEVLVEAPEEHRYYLGQYGVFPIF